MANYSDWDDLGRTIQDIVDRAVNSQDYQKLNQTIRQAVDKGTEAVRKVVDTAGQEVRRPTVTEPKKNLPVLYGATGGYRTKGVLKIVGGGVVSFFTLVGLIVRTGMEMIFGGPGMALGSVVLTLAAMGVGGGLIFSGKSTLDMVKRFKIYKKVLGDKTHCTMEKLARSVGKNVPFVRKETQKMIDAGLFPEGHIDREANNLIISDETYRLFEQSRLQLEERKRQEAAEQANKPAATYSRQVQDLLDKGDAFIREIRRCNDAIPGAEISAKIDRMEMIVRRIFARAKTNPEVAPDLKKMMDYYLPMTVKLLNAYADMDAQPVQGETIANSKREIEGTLDTLNRAFEKLLDDLFADTALDISSDITVLNTLLAQEGLTEDGLHKK